MVSPIRLLGCALLLSASLAWSQEPAVDGGFTGSWFDPDRSGEGWVLEILHDGTAFVAWFTYPPAAKGSPRQAWLVGSGTVDENRVTFPNLQQFSGPVFGPGFDPDALTASDWGPLEFTFSGCDAGTLSYAGPAEFGAAERAVVRLTGIGDAPCPAAKGGASRPVSSAWFDPSHNGEGWFLEELGDGRVNMYWFTYDANGNAAWVTGVGMRDGDWIVFDDVFLVTGPAFGEDFDPDAVTLEPWGTVTFELLECNLARLEYDSVLPGFGEGSLDPVRLTLLDRVTCEDADPNAPLTGGTWREIAPSFFPRSEVTAAVLDGIVYLSGGFGGPRVLESYDLATDQWTTHPAMPEGKNHHMAVGHQGQIYVFGGLSESTFSQTRSAFAYNPATMQWRQIADLPQTKAAANVALSFGSHIYLLGGTGSAPTLRYDPASDSYATLPQSTETRRNHSSAAVFGDELWLLGGRGTQGNVVSVEIFDPLAGTWRNGPDMLEGRSGFGAAAVQGQLMVVGGEALNTGQTLRSLEIYVPSRNQFVPGPDMPIRLHGIVAVEVDGKLLVLGGSEFAGEVTAAGRNYLYDPAPATE